MGRVKERMDAICQSLLSANPRFARLRSQEWKGVYVMSSSSSWKGFCIAHRARLQEDTLKQEEWAHGKRWRDPIL